MATHVNQPGLKLHHIGRNVRSWSRHHIPRKAFVFILGTVIGIIVGAGAFLLKKMVGFVSRLLTSTLHADSGNWILLLIPIAGIILTGIICRYLLHDHLSNGVTQLMRELKQKIFRLRGSRTYSFLVASTVTLGFGGSAGSEGPIANTGAAIGSNLASHFKMPPELVRIMIGCGAAAGIAGIFKSPMGGALFTIEVLRMEMTTISIILLLVTSVTAAMTAYLLSGGTIDLAFTHPMAFDFDLIPWVILLGVFCGFYSLYYSYFTKKTAQLLHHFTNPWVKNCIGGVILSSLIFLFPSLYGEGYEAIGKILDGEKYTLLNDSVFFTGFHDQWGLIIVAAGTLAAKCFATSATNHGGGVSGDFAPILFAGCIAGFLFASLLNQLFGLHIPTGLFAYFGMAGVMAGAIRAPLMAIFLTCEMSAGYQFFFPLMIAGAISFGIVRLFTADSFFSRHSDRNNGLISKMKKR